MKVVGVAGDGNCFFHSVAYGLNTTHLILREMCARYVVECPDFQIQDAPIKDWIKWESGKAVTDYSVNMRKTGVWGGAIEISCLCHMLNLIIEVYICSSGRFFRIAEFKYNQERKRKPKIVKVCYNGHSHYDAIAEDDGE